MPDVFLGEFGTDIDPPVVTSRSPAPLSTNLPENTNVSFDVYDVESYLDTNQLDVTINGTPVVVNGVAQVGYVVTFTPIFGGVHVDINPNTDFTSLSIVSVLVYARDLAPIYNEVTNSWSFMTGDTGDSTSPIVNNFFPVNGATGVPKTTGLSFDVIDPGGSGINVSTLNFSLGTTLVIVNGVFQVGFTGSITNIPFGKAVVVNPTVDLLLFETYTGNVSVQDGAANVGNGSWTFDTEVGEVSTPVLHASPLNAAVFLYWDVNPNMRVTLYELRRSTVSFPISPEQGELVFSGTSQIFTDLDVENDTNYYTVFVVRKFLIGVPLYVPYEEPASEDATPRDITTQAPAEPEYIPARGEIGTTTNPLPGSATAVVWSSANQKDIITVRDNAPVLSPVNGVVVSIEDSVTVGGDGRLSSISILGQSGIEYRLGGVIILQEVAAGTRIGSGQRIGSTIAGDASFRITKLPTGSFGRRSIRPAYFYATIEKREGSG